MPYATRQGIIDFPKKKLVKRDQKRQLTPVKEIPQSNDLAISSSARKALHNSNVIIGREKELEKLTRFLMSHLNNQTSGSIYLSGLPGTGKTACVNYLIEQNQLNKQFHVVKINCTAFNSSRSVFKRICEELNLKNIGKNEKDAISCIEKYLVKKHKMVLVILDEIDQLESKHQSVLYKLFEWPSLKNSKFILIGIANAMDLTSRNLPRLCVKMELKPMLLHFAPYSKDEIADILKKRLTIVGADKLFAPGAIELISAKVAGSSGDLRRALDLGKRVIEIAEQNQMQLQNSPLKKCVRSIEAKSPREKSPRKLELLVSEMIDGAKSPPKRKLNLSDESPKKKSVDSFEASPQKLMKFNNSERLCLTKPESNEMSANHDGNTVLRRSPRKLKSFNDANGEIVETSDSKRNLKSRILVEDNLWTDRENNGVVRRSPRKLNFDVNSKDVLAVVKNVFGPSKNFKSNEESCFPLHQKLLICALLLVIKKGKKKDANIGKLHQVYSKVCLKRGLTAVDKSGFIFLCRQAEVTGIIQIGKEPGTLAKITLRWDESEISNSIKDLNLLSSILNDVSCLS